MYSRGETINFIAESLRVDLEDVVPRASFIDDLGADSLDLIELFMAIEERHDIEIVDKDAERIATVADLLAYIEAKLCEDTGGLFFSGGSNNLFSGTSIRRSSL